MKKNKMKKLLILLFIVLLYTQNSFSQNTNSLNDIQKKIYNNEDVQVKAEFPNGEKKFNEFILENFKKPLYKNIECDIIVNFIVEIDGTISNVDIIKDAGNGTGEEIKRVLLLSPKWLPGEHEGYHVKTKVKFSLKL